jgi:hypothetical protein
MRFGQIVLASLATHIEGTMTYPEELERCVREKEKDFVECQVVGSCGQFVTLKGIRQCKRNDEQLEMLKNLAVVLEREFKEYQKPFLVRMKALRGCFLQVLKEQFEAGDRQLAIGLREVSDHLADEMSRTDAPEGALGRLFWNAFNNHIIDDFEEDEETGYMTRLERVEKLRDVEGYSILRAIRVESIYMEQARRALPVIEALYSEDLKSVAGLGICIARLERNVFLAIIEGNDIDATIEEIAPECVEDARAFNKLLQYQQHVKAVQQMGKTELLSKYELFLVDEKRGNYETLPLLAAFRTDERAAMRIHQAQNDVLFGRLVHMQTSDGTHPLVAAFSRELMRKIGNMHIEDIDQLLADYNRLSEEDKRRFLGRKREQRIATIAQLIFDGDIASAGAYEDEALHDLQTTLDTIFPKHD